MGARRSADSAPASRFVHTDVITAYSAWWSPSSPDDYVRALARQYPIGPDIDNQPRPALAIADYGLHSAVKTAVACDRAGIDHVIGLRVRVVAERTKRTFFCDFTRTDRPVTALIGMMRGASSPPTRNDVVSGGPAALPLPALWSAWV